MIFYVHQHNIFFKVKYFGQIFKDIENYTQKNEQTQRKKKKITIDEKKNGERSRLAK